MTFAVSRSLLNCRLLGMALALLMVSACGDKPTASFSPRPVLAVTVQPDNRSPVWSLPGQVAAREATPLSFRIDGKIINRSVRTGDKVSAGQVVAELDPKQVQQTAISATAQLKAAQQALDFAKRQLNRDRQQAKADLIARAQLEQSQNAYAQALAQHTRAIQDTAAATDRQAYSRLLANHDGIITAEHAQTGQNVGAGQAVYTLAWDAGFDVITDVPERLVGALQPGQLATVALTALPDQSFQASVREVAPMADPASRTFRVKMTLDQPSPDVRLGMTARASFTRDAIPKGVSAYTLPATALFHDGTVPAVWVVRQPDSTLELRQVQVLAYGEDTVSVTDGVNAGDQVLAKGVHTVSSGQLVRVIDSTGSTVGP